jgi:hypothetical protein
MLAVRKSAPPFATSDECRWTTNVTPLLGGVAVYQSPTSDSAHQRRAPGSSFLVAPAAEKPDVLIIMGDEKTHGRRNRAV